MLVGSLFESFGTITEKALSPIREELERKKKKEKKLSEERALVGKV